MEIDPITNLPIRPGNEVALFVLIPHKDIKNLWQSITLPIFGVYQERELVLENNFHNEFLSKRLKIPLKNLGRLLNKEEIVCFDRFITKADKGSSENRIAKCFVDRRVWDTFSAPVNDAEEQESLLEVFVTPGILKMLGFVENSKTEGYTHPGIPDCNVEQDRLYINKNFVCDIRCILVRSLIMYLSMKGVASANELLGLARSIPYEHGQVVYHLDKIRAERARTKKDQLVVPESNMSDVIGYLYDKTLFIESFVQLSARMLRFYWTTVCMSITFRPVLAYSMDYKLARQLQMMREMILMEQEGIADE
jgi:hypothetical protein